MAGQSRDNALDHVVVVVFENRSLDNVLGRLYGPGDGKTFEGVAGKDLTNPIPGWAEHGADRKVVPYAVATDIDSPNPDTGEEHQHANTQLCDAPNCWRAAGLASLDGVVLPGGEPSLCRSRGGRRGCVSVILCDTMPLTSLNERLYPPVDRDS